MSELTEDQVRNAAVIIKVGQDLKVPPRGWVIGVATALQESRLVNLPRPRGPQRPRLDRAVPAATEPGLGHAASSSPIPAYQSRKFFEKLLTIPTGRPCR